MRLTKPARTWGAAAVALALGAGALTVDLDRLATTSSLVPAREAAARQTPARDLPGSFADAIERVAPAVVNIQVTQRAQRSSSQQIPPGMRDFLERFFGPDFSERFGVPDGEGAPPGAPQPRGPRAMGLGSGFIIDKAGFIVTNNHVVDGAEEVQVTLQDGRRFDAEVVGTDAKTDLALLKIEAENLPHVDWGNSDEARVGDWVIAVGNPFGLDHSVTTGIISARGRSIGAGPYDDFMQIDASINRGNSGGPTFNLAGEVIGVNTAIFSPTGGSIGIGFAIPSQLAKSVIDQLKETGKVERGWLGVMIQEVTPELAEGLGLDKPEGAIVSGLTEGSPAAEAGIRQGDVILELNGERVTTMRELPRMVAQLPAGKDATLGVWRSGDMIDRTVTIGRMPDDDQVAAAGQGPSEPGPAGADVAGLKLSGIDAQARASYRIPDSVEGVLITAVEPGSAAAEQGINVGDVIVKVGQQDVRSPDDVRSQFEAAKKENRKSILLLVNRGEQARFIALPTV